MKDLTRVVRHPAVDLTGYASLAVPTYRASTIVFPNSDEYASRKARGPDGYTYGLQGTPTTKCLEAQLSDLENGARTLIVPSGQAAIAMVFMTVLWPGQKVLIPDNVYPPVKAFCADYLAPRGIDHDVYDPMLGARIGDLIDDQVRLVWMESPGSNTMEFSDIPAIVAVAKARGVLTGCDNTWATPLLFKPLDHGVDFSVEALTKYVGGHSDLLLGSISVADPNWHSELKDSTRLMGIGVSPDECSLALRGLETLGVRITHVERVATELAGRLAERSCIARVLHPSFPDCPGHEIWKRDFRGASGLFSVLLNGDFPQIGEALEKLQYFAIGASWGGTRSLLAPIKIEADRLASATLREGTILRISVGLEDADDLWSDLSQLCDALERVPA